MSSLAMVVWSAHLASLGGLNHASRVHAAVVQAIEPASRQASPSRGHLRVEGTGPEARASLARNAHDGLLARAADRVREAEEEATMKQAGKSDDDVKRDDATPAGAMRALQAAFRAGDEARIRKLTSARTPEQKRALEAKVRVWAQVESFFDSLDARFEPRQVGEHFPGIALEFTTRWIDPGTAVLTVDGDTAVLSNRNFQQKLIRENGHWKVYFDDWDEAAMAGLLDDGEPLAEALRQTTPEIREGRYRTLKEVKQSLMERVEAIKRQRRQGNREERLDDATPVAAMWELQTAFRTGDEVKIRTLTRAKTPKQKRALAVKVRIWAQVEPFFHALHGRIPLCEVNDQFAAVGLEFATRWINLDDAKLEVNGDLATLSSPFRRQKLIREDGHWKVYFDDWDEATVAALLANGEPFAEALRQTTPEVRAGEYRTAREVNEALMRRFEANKQQREGDKGKREGAERGGDDVSD